MARAEARESQVKILLHRSGGICYYPECGTFLDIAQRDAKDQPKNVGKIAHIRAASEGGPRYDFSMTDAERSSVENLIYLCGTCHDIVDSQVTFHTTDWLVDIKTRHEAKVRRGVRFSIQEVGFEHLEAVCSFLVSTASAPVDDNDVRLPLDIEEKLTLNTLTSQTRDKVRAGLAQSEHVASFIRMANETQPRYGVRLTAKIQQFYSFGVAEDLEGDELFDFVCALTLEHAGSRLTETLEAASVATVTHIFTQCDIFDNVLAATR